MLFARGLVFGCLAAAGALDATSVPVDGGAVALEWEPFDATQLPTACDFARIDAGEPDLFARVVNATGPLIIDGLVASSWRGFGDTLASRREFLRHHGATVMHVAAGSTIAHYGPDRVTDQYEASLGEFAEKLRARGALPADAYTFSTILANTSLAPEARHVGRAFGALLAARRPFAAAALAALRVEFELAQTRFALGGAGSGLGWHSHTDALAALAAGAKEWFVAREADAPWLREWMARAPAARSTRAWLRQRAGAEAASVRRCVQRPGELVWVPNGLGHATLNHGDAVSLSIQHELHGPLLPTTAQVHGEPGVRRLLGALAAESPSAVAAALSDADRQGEVPLHKFFRTASLLRALLDAGANVDVQDSNGRTPLFMASEGHIDSVRVLLEAGANANLQDKKGVTPLHVAALLGEPEVVRMLLDAGARKDLRNSHGKLPRERVCVGRNNQHKAEIEAMLSM